MTYQSAALGDNKIQRTFGHQFEKHRKIALATAGHGVVAGLAGGLAEVAWVMLYAGVTGISSAKLAQGVTAAAGLRDMIPATAAAVGVTIHLALSATLGIALAFSWRALSSLGSKSANPFPLMLTLLVGIWSVNFLVVLPIISPGFVHLLPYPVSLMSKVLFALAAAEILRRQDRVALYAHRALVAGGRNAVLPGSRLSREYSKSK